MPKNQDFTTSDLTKFLAREAYGAKALVERLFSEDPEKGIAAGDVLGPLRPVVKAKDGCTLQANNIYFSRFRSGDRVEIAQLDPRTKRFQKLSSAKVKSVEFPKPGLIEISITADLLPKDDKAEFFLLPISSEVMHWQLRRKLQTLSESQFVATHSHLEINPIKKSLDRSTERLNPVQKEALRFLVESDLQGLVQGPPGTGKTHLLVDLVKLLVDHGVRVGLACLSHAAVDNALAKIVHSGIDPDVVVRSGQRDSIKTEPYKNFDLNQIWCSSFKELVSPEQEEPNQFLVYAATLHSWCLSNHAPEVDVLILDEASQVPIYFHPFLNALSSRVIMFGDHKQLPPVIQTENHNLPAQDVFTYEIERGTYPMLATQYRMNQEIQEWSSNRFYNGRLHPHESNRDRDLLRGRNTHGGLLGDSEVNLILNQGRPSNNANIQEASQVADLVWQLTRNGNLPLSEVGIVTPHRAQAGAICASLQEKLGILEMRKILVDTVERFQGQEKEAMIFSMGVDRDSGLKGDRGFLGDGRRLNVAVTRARSRFYCLAPHRLIDNSKMQKNAGHLNSFLEWCGASADPTAQK